MSLTSQQTRIIAHLKKVGFGYRKFAENVEKQGWCSAKQEDTLCNMYNKVNSPKPRYTRWNDNITDNEIMSFGLHI